MWKLLWIFIHSFMFSFDYNIIIWLFTEWRPQRQIPTGTSSTNPFLSHHQNESAVLNRRLQVLYILTLSYYHTAFIICPQLYFFLLLGLQIIIIILIFVWWWWWCKLQFHLQRNSIQLLSVYSVFWFRISIFSDFNFDYYFLQWTNRWSSNWLTGFSYQGFLNNHSLLPTFFYCYLQLRISW